MATVDVRWVNEIVAQVRNVLKKQFLVAQRDMAEQNEVLVNLPGGQLGFLVVSMAVIFALGFFIDFFEIAFIVVPLLLPSARELLGPESLLWFGVLIGANLQTSFLTPPFGFALFYLRGVAPKSVTTGHIYRGVIPFVLIQIIGLTMLYFAPSIVTIVPQLLGGN